MDIITLDLETYYDDDYTLTKLSTEEYIRDRRFEALGLGVRFVNGDLKWFDEPDEFLHHLREDAGKFAVLAHHAQFDGLILSHHYGVKPYAWRDTFSMARLLLGNHLSVKLDSLAKHFGLSGKTINYASFKGRRRNQLDAATRTMLANGCLHDVSLTWQLFNILAQNFPREEFEVIDSVIRMFTEPVLRADLDMLGQLWLDENNRKQKRLQELNISETDLQSAERFAQLLRAEGIEPATKQGKNKSSYAFAKTDQFMRDLLEHDNERVQTLAEARLDVKSTILQTRAETLGWMGRRGPLPVYLNYAGAGTLRVSGGDGANWLNFKRRSAIRKSILAPEGYLLGPVDASQIECRVLNYLADQEDVIEKFRKGEDPYVGIASQFYGEVIYKPAKDDPRHGEMEAKRGMGKQGELMCGYGSAGPKFKETAKAGLYGPPVDIPLEDATRFVKLYRQTHPAICDWTYGYWATAERMLGVIARGESAQWGPLTIYNHRLYLPNGCPLIYDTLEWHIPAPDEENVKDFEWDGFWRLRTRKGWKKMWGSKLTQNICEAVARVIVSQAMIRVKHMGYRSLNWPYDELLLLIPNDGRAANHLERCRQELIREVKWLPGIPLDAEATLGERYSK